MEPQKGSRRGISERGSPLMGSPQEGGTLEKVRRREGRLAAALAALALAAPVGALGAGALAAGALGAATCIVSGDPAAVATNDSHTAFSEGTALVTGTLSCPSAPVALRTDAVTGALIYF